MALACVPFLHPGLKAHLDLSVMHLHAACRGRLLDIGCGSGQTVERLGQLGWQAQGVDPDPTAVDVARKKGLQVQHGTVQSCHFDDASFDAVTLCHVIEHLHDPRGTLAECHRILKPGGRLVVITPNIGSMLHAKFGQHCMALDPPRHLVLFTVDSLRNIAQQAGFSSLQVTTTSREANVQDFASRLIRRNGRYEWGRQQALWLLRCRGQVTQYVEALAMKFGGCCGEELLLLAKK